MLARVTGPIRVRTVVAGLAIACSLTALAQPAAPARALVTVVLDRSASATPVSGRLLVFMSSTREPLAPSGPGFSLEGDDQWIAAQEVDHWIPEEAVHIDVDQNAAPGPLSRAPASDYMIAALLNVDHNTAYRLLSAGDLRSPVSRARGVLGGGLELHLTARVPPRPVVLPEGQEAFAFPSPSLSAFWGRPVAMEGIVVLPPDYASSQARYPTAYFTHGFGGGMHSMPNGAARRIAAAMASGELPPMIWVLLNQATTSGTHEFVDSVNNGPWGHALTTELIPFLERKYLMDARPSGRFLNGHSSGGWAALWLQVAYPDVFGGAWATAPDPVDFRRFAHGLDLYANESAYRSPDGTATTFVRAQARPAQTVERFVRYEGVLGEYGGQWSSYEWVFGPRAPDGRAARLFNRSTGAIDHEVASHWRRYDLSHLLSARAAELVPKLRGKLHVIVGTDDNYFLDEPIRLLHDRVTPLGYDARFTYLAGRTHFETIQNGERFGFAHGGLNTRIAMQMYDVARPGHSWKPTILLDPSTELAR